MDDAREFWKNIQEEIKAQHTTQEWVSRKAGISMHTFQGWISKGIFPRVNEAAKIAQALNRNVEYFLTGSIRDNTKALEKIRRHLPHLKEQVDEINKAAHQLG
jgi:transcriptional regulator with XRE-family HTH domain